MCLRRTNFLAGAANGEVVVVEDNADLVHETDLLLIIADEIVVVGGRSGAGQRGVDLGKQAEDIFGRDLWRLSDSGGGGSAHVGPTGGLRKTDGAQGGNNNWTNNYCVTLKDK